ncbi:MAG TPA: hydrolase [Pseudogracilibacillus sp.]|nr:hydrolase [Pseudogracilibacillus sp.]
MMTKKQYYVKVQSKEISSTAHGDGGFLIEATDGEVELLRKKFNDMHANDFDTFFRAHVPIMPYSDAESNDRYSDNISDIYAMIYDLGVPETKQAMVDDKIIDASKEMK